MKKFEETEAQYMVSSGDQSLMSRRCIEQIMSHHPVYTLLRREAVEGMGRTITMYSVSAAEEGYIAQLSTEVVMKPVESETQLMKIVGQGIDVHESRYFIPTLGIPADSGGVEALFFWLDREGPAPQRMVTLKSSKRPEQAGQESGTKGPLVGAWGESRLVNMLVRHVGSAFGFKHFCLLCDRPVSGRNRCSRCRAAAYCDADCQKADWPRHRADCCSPQC